MAVICSGTGADAWVDMVSNHLIAENSNNPGRRRIMHCNPLEWIGKKWEKAETQFSRAADEPSRAAGAPPRGFQVSKYAIREPN